MYLIVKRILDIVLALILLLIVLPIFLIIILLQLLFNNADVFYLQKRIGLRNKTFSIYKFSTMLKNS